MIVLAIDTAGSAPKKYKKMKMSRFRILNLDMVTFDFIQTLNQNLVKYTKWYI